ncbi:MAG: Lrp/AsnC family transcriptional regulator [Coprobacillus cateniformis]|uniref:Lrp/AsnC family transcriptional regulator n=1 Tax=Longibaculum muris TaxID=1796628 RepID=UPI003AB91628|nr:Lrp/AsnC family transcriptional regulator [Coprobacillus cateniformis]
MEDKLLLSLLQRNARMKITDLAAALDETEDDVIEKLSGLERQKVICGYHTIINWDLTNTEMVTALIQINASPEREYGYDRIASRIYKYDEIDTMYLLSGSFEFVAIVKGKTMQEVAHFVASKLACLDGVSGTSTYFVLKQYKNDGVILIEDEDGQNDRLVVTP